MKPPDEKARGNGQVTTGQIRNATQSIISNDRLQWKFDRAFLDNLRDRLADYLAASGVELKAAGGRMVGRCPMHQDNRPSFAVFDSGRMAGCYPCDWKGDIFALAQWTGRASTFPEAVDHVAAVLGVPMPGARHTPPPASRKPATTAPRAATAKPTAAEIPDLPAEFEEAHRAARFALWDGCRRRTLAALAVSRELGVSLETLESLTFTSDALGLEDGRILYLYETGCKLRNRPGASKRFEWTHGRAVLPWRWHFAARPEVRKVFVTEGESDAVAAIAAGLEELHPKDGTAARAVVAAPGTAFPQSWGGLFRGKHAVLLFDRDAPGQAGAKKVAGILAPFAASVKIAKWEGGEA